MGLFEVDGLKTKENKTEGLQGWIIQRKGDRDSAEYGMLKVQELRE